MEINNTFFLLIGIERYNKDFGLGNLTAASNNVSMLRQILQKKYGVSSDSISDTHRRIDDSRSLYSEIDSVVKEKERFNTLVIYYSGHGVQLDGDGLCLSTWSTNPGDPDLDYAISLVKINELLMKSPQLNLVLILDCCFSERAINYFKQPNRVIITASSSDSTTLYPKDADCSVFTEKLINVLKNGSEEFGEYLTFEDLYELIKIEESTVIKSRFSRSGAVAEIPFFLNQKVSKEVSEEDETYLRNIFESVVPFNPALSAFDSLRKMKAFVLSKYPYVISYLLKNCFDDRNNVTREYIINFYDVIKRFFFYVLAAKLMAKKSTSDVGENTVSEKAMLPLASDFVQKIDEIIKTAETSQLPSFEKEIHYWNSGLRGQFLEMDALVNTKNDELLKKGLMGLIAALAFTTTYHFLSVKLIKVQYNNKYMKIPKYEHVACLLTGESLNGYDMTVFLDRIELSLVWEKFYFNKAVILTDHWDRERKEIKGVVNMWPFMIDQTVYSMKDTTDNERRLPALMLFDGKEGGDYMYKPLELQRNTKSSYHDLTKAYLTKETIRDQFKGFEDDLRLLL